MNSLTITADPTLFARQQKAHQLTKSARYLPSKFDALVMTAKRPASASGLLNVDEAATFLHRDVSKRTIYSAISNGTLWAKRIGKSYYTTSEALENYTACQDQDYQRDCDKGKTTKRGSSMMEKNVSGRDMVRASMNRQKQSLKNT